MTEHLRNSHSAGLHRGCNAMGGESMTHPLYGLAVVAIVFVGTFLMFWLSYRK